VSTLLGPDLRILDPKILERVESVLMSGQFINGPGVGFFEKSWAEVTGSEYCVGVASGSAALKSILTYIRRKSPDKQNVILPRISFYATAEAVVSAGFTPYYVDVGPDGGILVGDVKKILEGGGTISPQSIAAVVVVHLYGKALQMNTHIQKLARELGIPFVEDACQAHGVFNKDFPHYGIAAAYSFYPAKNLGAAGDAGAVVTNDMELADFVRAYINYGDPKGQKFNHSLLGTNERMDTIQAAVLNGKLESLKSWNNHRSQVAGYYAASGLKSIASRSGLEVVSNWHLYPILVKERDIVMEQMRTVRRVSTGNHYPYTLDSLFPGERAFESLCFGDSYSKVLSEHTMTLPIGTHVTMEMAAQVVNAFQSICKRDKTYTWRLKE